MGAIPNNVDDPRLNTVLDNKKSFASRFDFILVEDLNISAVSGNVAITAAADGELAFFEVSRQTGSDTYNADARLIGIKLHYTTSAATDA